MPWTQNERLAWGLQHFGDLYRIGWNVPKDDTYSPDDDERSKAAQRILGIVESKIGHYSYSQLFGSNDSGDGGWIFHPSLYWSGPNPIQNRLRLARHRKALALFRETHTPVQHISDRGVQFIASFEGYYGDPYLDPVGVPTIGYGHTGPDVYRLGHLTKQGALALLKHDLVSYEDGVKQRITVALTQGGLDALTSFAYNLGAGALDDGIASKVNHGDKRGAADEILLYDHAGGQVLPGLTRRRRAERAMFLS
jgi:lysozyme